MVFVLQRTGFLAMRKPSDEIGLKFTKKMADNLNYFSDDEESEWLANIDLSLLDKSNEEKQSDDSKILSFSEENRNSNTTKKMKTDLNVWTCQFRSASHTSATHST